MRRGNEDFVQTAKGKGLEAFVVCDGMGGAAAGEVASHLAASTFLEHMTSSPCAKSLAFNPRERLLKAIQAANTAVYRSGRHAAHLRGMGTTLVALLYLCEASCAPQIDASKSSSEMALPPTTLWLANVGDSRCYLYRNNTLAQLTSDHSVVQEQVRAGEITPAEAATSPIRNIITRAIGSRSTVLPDIDELHPIPGDLFLLASDGLTLELSDGTIEQILDDSPQPSTPSSLRQTCQALVDAANRKGGNDNIAVLLIAFP